MLGPSFTTYLFGTELKNVTVGIPLAPAAFTAGITPVADVADKRMPL